MLNEWGLQSACHDFSKLPDPAACGGIGRAPPDRPDLGPANCGYIGRIDETQPGRGEGVAGLGQVSPTGTTAATAPPPSTALATIVGAVAGAAIGALGGVVFSGGVFKGPLQGAAWVGGGMVVGAAGGYVVGKQPAAQTNTPTTTPTTNALPPGPYTRLGTSPALQPGGTYLISASTAGVGNLQTKLQDVVKEIQSYGMTVLGSWIGIPPAGWPSDDPNAAAGIFVAVKNTTASTGTDLSSDLTVYATGGATS